MRKLVIRAMDKLAEVRPHFNLTKKGTRQTTELEDAFQEQLAAVLADLTRSDGWEWCRERCFNTESLVNRRGINVDIMGFREGKPKVAVELKYVTATYSPNGVSKPSDEPAFSYDVAWDCLKLELLLAGDGVCQPVVPTDDVDPFVIALTNWPDFWQGRPTGRRPYSGWAKYFWERLLNADEFDQNQDDGIVFDGEIPSAGRNPDRTIFGAGGERCHIAFGLGWRGRWHEYGSPECARQHNPCPEPYCRFRYLLLTPGAVRRPSWHHWHSLGPDEQSKTIPFLRKEARDGYWREARRVRGIDL